jgi:hypothetical protein
MKHYRSYIQVLVAIILTTPLFISTGCEDDYNRRLNETLDYLSTGLKLNDKSLRKWEAIEAENTLRRNERKEIESGIIYVARYETFATKTNNYASLMIQYVCGDSSVRQVQILNKGEIVVSLPAKNTIRDGASRQPHTLCYAEHYIWRESDSNNPIAKYNLSDLSVVLVKENGSKFGPAPILSKQAVMEKVNALK